MGARNQPNLALRDALTEAGWTGHQLASEINAAGAEMGLRLSYDRTAVAHWLSGTRPRRPVPDLLAEVFSRRLARPVTPAGLGFVGQAAADDSSSMEQSDGKDFTLLLTDLYRAGRLRKTAMPAYSLSALEVPAWPAAEPPPGKRRKSDRAPVTAADAEAAERLVEVLAAGDAAFGGGRVRQAAAAYLAADLAPKLHARVRPAVRRRLFSAATDLAYLCGFTFFDDELHSLSQRYYQIALWLALENGDRASYAITLRALSVQANSLGHHGQARSLAESAADGIWRLEPRSQAFVYGQLAVTRAADRDRPGALLSLAAAERRLDQATSPGGVVGAYHIASLAHQEAAVQGLLGDQSAAVASLGVSIRNRPAGERRSRAITLALLAELELSTGHLDEAVRAWHDFLDDCPYLDSGRVASAMRRLRARVRPLARNPAVRTLLQHANASGLIYRAEARGW